MNVSPEEILIYAGTFAGVVVFAAMGFALFSAGWECYGGKYLKGAERSLEDQFLTIPLSHLVWLSVLAAVAPAVLGALVLESLPAGATLGLAGALSPLLALRTLKARRDALFKEQLVEALATLTSSLRSGFSLPRAFRLIAHDMPKPISQELGILVQELRLGADLEEGLASLHRRMPSDDLDLVVTAVAISSSVGGNLAEVFDNIGATIRERRRVEGRIDALTSQGKLQAVVVSLLPVVVGLAIELIDPSLMAPLVTTLPGWCVLGAAAVMEVSGFFFIRRIVAIEV